MDSAKGTRLNSWKEIATYLKCAQRTAPRWEEDRGLPVHRIPGGQRNAVFAYTTEIDAWLTSRNNSTQDSPESNSSCQPSQPISPPNSTDLAVAPVNAWSANAFLPSPETKKWVLLAAALCTISIVWGIGISVTRSHASASGRTGGFVRLTDDGHIKHNLRTDGATLYFNEIQGGRQVLMSTTVHGGSIRQIPTPFSNLNIQEVSHDGRKLLITSFEGIEYEEPLWVISPIGGIPQRVGTAKCHSASWSPDDGQIACASRNSIILMESDGSNQRELASFPGAPETLAWSPDGTRVRFLLPEPGTTAESPWELNIDYLLGRATSPARRLPFATDCCVRWAWTQDGKSFVYTSRATPDKPNAIVKSTGDSLIRLSASRVEIPVGIGRVDSIAPGKSDRDVFVLIGNTWRGELVKIDPKKNTLESFLHGISACYVSFSPDGQWISYVDSVDGSLWRSKADGTEPKRLTPASLDVELPSWSPDGNQIAFTGRNPGEIWRIFLVNKDGGVLREASNGHDNQGAPSWSPDGKSIVYGNIECHDIRICAVHRITLDSRKVEMVPGSEGFRTARWSPDGRYIAALQPEAHELMLYEISTQRWKSLADAVTGDDISWSHDSRSLYVDSPQAEKPVIERVRIKDGNRTTVGNLSMLQKMPGDASMWFGLAPDDSLIVLHFFNATEVYALDGTDR